MSPVPARELLATPAPPGQDPAAWRRDVERLICHVCGINRAHLLAHPEYPPTAAAYRHLQELLARRECGVPLAYLTGYQEFWSLRLALTPDTLIPRPETELLVERALAVIPIGQALRVVDIGTGSGAVALALAHERPLAQIYATDISAAALTVARANAAALGKSDIQFLERDGAQDLPGLFDVVVSNPPYVAETDPCLLGPGLAFEPLLALSGGAAGLAVLAHVIAGASTHLRTGGHLLLEHGTSQGSAVQDLLASHGYQHILCWRDLAGHDRVTGATWGLVDG